MIPLHFGQVLGVLQHHAEAPRESVPGLGSLVGSPVAGWCFLDSSFQEALWSSSCGRTGDHPSTYSRPGTLLHEVGLRFLDVLEAVATAVRLPLVLCGSGSASLVLSNEIDRSTFLREVRRVALGLSPRCDFWAQVNAAHGKGLGLWACSLCDSTLDLPTRR